MTKRATLTRDEVVKVLQDAGVKEIDWSKIDFMRLLAFVMYVLEFWRNPPITLKGALDHDPASACLHEAICHNMEAVCIMTQHLKECYDNSPTPEPTA